jgi:hypothetical protein
MARKVRMHRPDSLGATGEIPFPGISRAPASRELVLTFDSDEYALLFATWMEHEDGWPAFGDYVDGLPSR